MARIRTIKPDFWLDEDLALLDPTTRLLAIGLLNHSDDEGYFKAHPMIIKAAVFPFMEDSVSVQTMLIQLEKVGYLTLFTGTDGKAYGFVKNFAAHQVISRPSASKIKELDSCKYESMSTHGVINEDSTEEGKGKEGKGSTSEDVIAVFSHWQKTMNKPLAKLDDSRRSKIQARLKSFNPDQLISAIDGCANSEFHMGKNNDGRLYNNIDLIFRNDSKTEEFIHTVPVESYASGGLEL